MPETMDEERHFERIHFDCLVKFEFGVYRHDCELIDISLRGALIANCTGATDETGTACKLILSLDDSNNAQIIMLGHIAHKKHNRIGIKCEKIDLDSMTHLRKLVEINSGDPQLLERELAALRA